MINKRNDYESIYRQFSRFIDVLKSKKIENLNNLVEEEAEIYLSVINNINGENHTLECLKMFILDIPEVKRIEYKICNYICRLNDINEAYQCAEVVVVFQNDNEKPFQCVITFCNQWVYIQNNWKILKIRGDFDNVNSSLMYAFKKRWYFENKIADLKSATHLPCILPDLDSPYFHVPLFESCLSEYELIEECFYKFLYGIDWLIFKYCKETLSNKFVNKRKFIIKEKFLRQVYHYTSHPYYFETIVIHNNQAVAQVNSLLEQCKIKEVSFYKKKNKWEIIEFKED